MTQPAHGEWYLATDGKWYCWPDPTPYDEPPPPPAPPAGSQPDYQPGFGSPTPAAPQAVPAAPGYGAPGYAPIPDYGAPAGYATNPYGQPVAEEPVTNAAWLAIAGGALCVAGSMMPWANVDAPFVTFSRSGMDGGDGMITLILGLAAALVGVGAIARWALPEWTRWVPIVASALAALVAVANFVDVKNKGDLFTEGTEGFAAMVPGSGLYVIVVGALVGAIGGWLLRRE